KETDTCTETPKSVVKSILTEGQFEDGSEHEVIVEFNAATPAGAVLRVKFSKEIAGKHYDMLSIAPLDPAGEGRALVTVGAAQVATGVVNVGTSEIGGLQFWIEPYFDPYMLPECSIDRPAKVWQDGRTMQIQFAE